MKKISAVLLIIIMTFCACENKNNDGNKKIHTPFFTDEPTSVMCNLDYSYVEFGSYPQTKITDINDEIINAKYNTNSIANISGSEIKRVERKDGYEYYLIEPIIWKVIEVDDDEAILITDKVIDCLPYNDNGGMVKWEDSSVRKYLNSIFIESAFTKEERQNIVESKVKNYSSSFGYPQTEQTKPQFVYDETIDYVYLTSKYELDTYIFNNPYAKDGNKDKYKIKETSDFYNAESSDYALDIFNENLPYGYEGLNSKADKCYWMLRTYIEDTDYVCFVNNDNTTVYVEITDDTTFTNKSDDVLGIRPKLRVKTKALETVKG